MPMLLMYAKGAEDGVVSAVVVTQLASSVFAATREAHPA
jgi:hypothetical protein